MLLSGLALASCEPTLDIDVPVAPPQLVVNSIFTPDSVWSIEVSTSAMVGGSEGITTLKDANVTLYQDGTLIDDIIVDSLYLQQEVDGAMQATRIYQYRSQSSRPQEESQYSIHVIHPRYEPATARGQVPQPVQVVPGKDSPGNDETHTINGQEMRQYDFTLIVADQGQYFGIEVISQLPDGKTEEKIEFFSSEDIFSGGSAIDEPVGSGKTDTDDGHASIESGRTYNSAEGIFFDDQTFEGQQKQVSIFIGTNYGGQNSNLKLRIRTLSQELYDFLVEYQRQQDNTGNPFAEPSQVFSNIEGGYGIFAGYTTTTLDLR